MAKRKGDESPETLVGSIHMQIPEAEKMYGGVAEQARRRMVERGIYMPSRPSPERTSRFLDENGAPLMPDNVQSLDEQELGELYGVVQKYYSYITGQVADAKNAHKEALRVFKFIEAKVRLAKDGTSKDKDAKKTADRRYVIADHNAFEAECYYNLLLKVAEATEADLKQISRQISLREQSIKTGTRMAGIGARRKFKVPDRTHYREEDQEPEEVPPQRPKSRRPPRRRPPMRKR